MESQTECPEQALLLRYLAGDLPEAQRSGIAQHLTACVRCNTTYRKLESDATGGAQKSAEDVDTIVQSGQDSASRFGQGAPTGTRLDNYEVLNEISRGGMGIVYRARQRGAERVVALKMVLGGGTASREEIERFRQEVEAAAKLEHPAIVPIYEVGEVEGQPFFSMGFIDGPSLASRLRHNPLEPAEAVRICHRISEAIAYAHRRGVVHRDVKPSNILLDASDKPYITDFGLAKQIEGDAELTTTGQVIGTPSFMPPEQAQGQLDQIGPPSDVYSIGAVLYACLTGRPPFYAASVIDTLNQVIHDEPASPRSLNRKIDRDLETICTKCLQKNPGQRYPGADELAADLERWMRREPIRARRATALERAIKWSRRRPTAAALAATSMLGLIALGMAIAGSFYNERLRAALRETRQAKALIEEERDRTSKALVKVTEANQQAEQADYYRRIALAENAWEQNRMMEMKTLLDGTPNKYRHWEYTWLSEHRLRSTTRVGLSYPPSDLVVSPDSSQIVVSSNFGVQPVSWYDAADLHQVAGLEHAPDQNPFIRLCSDGRHVAMQMRTGEVKLVDGPNRKQRGRWNPAREHCHQLCVAPSARWIARVVGTEGEPATTMSILNVDRSINEKRWEHDFPISKIAVTPDSGLLIVAGTNDQDSQDTVVAYDTTSWQPLVLDEYQGGGVTALAIDAKRNRIMAGYQNRHVRVLEFGSDAPIAERHMESVATAIDAAEDGRIAIGLQGGEAQIWDGQLAQLRRRLRGHLRDCTLCRFVPGENDLITGSDDLSIRRWYLDAPQVPVHVASQQGDRRTATALAWSPDSRWICVAERVGDAVEIVCRRRLGTGGQMHRYDYAQRGIDSPEGTEIVVLGFHDGQLVSVDRDGRMMVWDRSDPKDVQAILRCTLPRPVDAAAFSTGGRRLLSASGKRLFLVDLATGKKLTHVVSGGLGIRSVCFSDSDEKALIASQYDKKNAGGLLIERCRFDTRQCEALQDRSYSDPSAIRVTAGGQSVVIADEIGQVYSRDATWGSPLWGDSAHLARVRALAVSPDQGRIVSCCDRGRVMLRDASTGQIVLTLQQRGDPIVAAEFSPDNRSLVTLDEDGDLTIWPLSKAPPISDRLGRG